MPLETNQQKTYHKYTDATQVEGNIDIDLLSSAAKDIQVSFNVDNITSGTLNVWVKYDSEASWEPLVDVAGSPRVVDLSPSVSKSFSIKDAWIHALRFVPTTVVGSYDILIKQGTITKTIRTV